MRTRTVVRNGEVDDWMSKEDKVIASGRRAAHARGGRQCMAVDKWRRTQGDTRGGGAAFFYFLEWETEIKRDESCGPMGGSRC